MIFQHCHEMRCSSRSILLHQELSRGALSSAMAEKAPKARTPAVWVHCQVQRGDTKSLNSLRAASNPAGPANIPWVLL